MFDFISVHFFILFSRTIILQFVPLFANSTHKCNFLNYTPAGESLQLMPNSKFKILSPSHSSHLSHLSHLSHPSYLSHPSHNSKFIIPLALFGAHYRLEKLFSLWCIKENSRAILLYFTDCKAIEILTTHLIHYQHYLLPRYNSNVSIEIPCNKFPKASKGSPPYKISSNPSAYTLLSSFITNV